VSLDAVAHGRGHHLGRQVADHVGTVGVAVPAGVQNQLFGSNPGQKSRQQLGTSQEQGLGVGSSKTQQGSTDGGRLVMGFAGVEQASEAFAEADKPDRKRVANL
jgi:hypothetical protein